MGLSGNLPNATNTQLTQNGTTLGSVSGSNTKAIAQNQLPNVSLAGTTNNIGNHEHGLNINSGGVEGGGARANYALNNITNSPPNLGGGNTTTNGAHTHTVSVNLNGNVAQQTLDIRGAELSVNTYIYLGL